MVESSPTPVMENPRVANRGAALACLNQYSWQYGQIYCVGYLAEGKPHMLVGIGVSDATTETELTPHYRIICDTETGGGSGSLYTTTVMSNGMTYDVTNTTITTSVSDPFEFKEITA